MNNTTTTSLLLTTSSSTNTPRRRIEEGGQREENSGRSNTTINTSSTIPSNIQHETIAPTQAPNNYSRESTILKNNSRSSSNAQEISSFVQGSFSETMSMNTTDKIAGITGRANSVSPISESKPTNVSSCIETFTNPYHTPLLGTQSMIESCVPIRKLPNLTINVNSGLPPFDPAVLPAAGSHYFAKPNQSSPPPPSNFPTIPTPPSNFTTNTTLSSGTCTSVLGNSNFGSIPFSFSKPTSSFAELGDIISQGNFGMNNPSTYCNDTISCASTTSSTMEEPKKVKNRKEKSLTMICTKFIQYYEEKTNSPTTSQSKGDIKIEEAVNTLGIEKRRIYDILNVLESISIVTKVGVSCYKFNGTKCLHSTLEQMKNNAYTDPLLFEGIQSLPRTPQNEPILKSLSKFKQSPMSSSSRSNTLTCLSRLLIMCFLATEVKEITQDQLLAIVLKDSTEKSKFSIFNFVLSFIARTRRLNDIVNILSAIHLLEKKTEKSVNIFKWLGGSFMNETKPANSILSPSKMPLKKRKRVKTGSQGSDSETSPTAESGPFFPMVETQSESTSVSETPEVSPISIPSVSPSFFQSTTSATTCKTPTSGGSNNSGGLHFQFRSPPSKKNKTIPLSSFTTILGGPKISPKNLNPIFKTSELVTNPNIPSPITPNSAISTTIGKLGSGFSGSIFSQTAGQVPPRVMPSTIKATISNENNKENVSSKTPISQTAKKLSSNDSTQQGKIIFKIRGGNETSSTPRQPLGLKTDNGTNNQQNIKAPRP